MKRVCIVGATGFGGIGLIEILERHPQFSIGQLIARRDAGRRISDVFPHLRGFNEMTVQEPDDIDYSSVDLAFFSTPDRAGMTLIRPFYEKGIPVIDFSGDFRFPSTEEYQIYATNKSMDTDHCASDLLEKAVYGLPELYREKIASSRIIGNPGCFAIGMILALVPAISAGIISSDTIICDGKTGVSGAGKLSGETNLYPQRYENINSYREGKHQHLVEVEQVINKTGTETKKIMFIPQVIPMNRGILTTIYATLKTKIKTDELNRIYREYYKNEPFVRIQDTSPNTAEVRGSNLCAIMPRIDERTGTMYLVSVIDNLLKGQAGNAVQNANIIMGFQENMGLTQMPFYP